MRKTDYKIACRETAKIGFKPSDYDTLLFAMQNSALVLFDYFCDRQFKEGSCTGSLLPGGEVWLTYRRLVPRDFTCMKIVNAQSRDIYVNALHELHGQNELFRADKIKNVREIGNIILALLNPSKYISFLDGSAMCSTTTRR